MNVQLRSSELTVSIHEIGAELCSVKNKKDDEYIWQADPTVWARHAPVLFPIVGKLKDDLFLYEGKKFTLPQHGFGRDLNFNLIKKEDQHCLFELRSSAETLIRYPFSFKLQIEYTLTKNLLRTNYNVKNEGNELMFFSLGAHPGFSCENLEEYYLEFKKDELNLTRLQNGLLGTQTEKIFLKDKKLDLKKELFEQDALILENSQIDRVSLCSKNSGKRITMNCDNWPYFGIWSKKGCEQFVCLEPWHGITDSTNTDQQLKNKKGIIRLAPQKTFSCSFELIFD